jgi:hypothetical protein
MPVSVVLRGGPVRERVIDLPVDEAPEFLPIQTASGETPYRRTGARDKQGRRVYEPARLIDRLTPR